MQSKFEGKTDGLKGFIYDWSDSRQAEVFAETTREIAEYVGRTYIYGHDTLLAIKNLAMPVHDVPNDPPTNASRLETRLWEKKVDYYVKRKIYLEENMKTLYWVVWGQCTYAVRFRLEALDGHNDMSEKADSIALLKAIRALLVDNFQSHRYAPLAVHEAMCRFYRLSQDKHSTCQVYLERFQNCVDGIEHYGGSIGQDPVLVNKILEDNGKSRDTASPDEIDEAQNTAQEQYLAEAFLLGSDRDRYGKLLEDLESLGKDNYPKTVTAAYSLLTDENKGRGDNQSALYSYFFQ
jgi:hypothetical protein